MTVPTDHYEFHWWLRIRDDDEWHECTVADSGSTEPGGSVTLEVPSKYLPHLAAHRVLEIEPSCTRWDGPPGNRSTGSGRPAKIESPTKSKGRIGVEKGERGMVVTYRMPGWFRWVRGRFVPHDTLKIVATYGDGQLREPKPLRSQCTLVLGTGKKPPWYRRGWGQAILIAAAVITTIATVAQAVAAWISAIADWTNR